MPFQVGGLLEVSVLVSLEIHLVLSAGQSNALLRTVLVRLSVCWKSLSCPGYMSTGVPVLFMLSFCLRSLSWSSLRSVDFLCFGQI